MRVRFVRLTHHATASRRVLDPETPVAQFGTEGGVTALVPLSRITPFDDVRDKLVAGGLRGRATLLLASCEHVVEAPADERGIDPSRRFALASDRHDAPGWRVDGFQDVRRVDLKLLKHAVGLGEADPDEAVARWSRLLDLPIDRAAITAALDAAGCTAWRRIPRDRDDDAPLDPYQGLDTAAFARCVRALGALRERFLTRISRAIASSADMAAPRHAHLGTAERERVLFLDDDGVLVVAGGARGALRIRTAYNLLRRGEARLNGRARAAGRARALESAQGRPVVHSPQRWS